MKYNSKTVALVLVMMALALISRASAKTDTIFPYQQQYGSGWDDSASKHNGDIRWVSGQSSPWILYVRGWCDFDLRSLRPNQPSNYRRIILHYYEFSDTNNPSAKLMWCGYARPLTQPAGVLWNNLAGNFWLGTKTGGIQWHVDTLPGWATWPMNPALDSELVIGWLEPASGSIAKVGWAYGWTSANPPFLEFEP